MRRTGLSCGKWGFPVLSVSILIEKNGDSGISPLPPFGASACNAVPQTQPNVTQSSPHYLR